MCQSPACPPKTCPDREALLDYLVGKLPDASADSLASHLDSCTTCQAELATLSDREDTLIAQLRGSPPPDSFLDEPQCEAAMARARAVAGDCPDFCDGRGLSQFSRRAPGAAWSAAKMGLSPLAAQETSAVSFPRQLGEYCLIERLGSGGMGTVYKALHSKLDRVVALKILPRARTDDPRAVVRFEREMKAIGRLDHPHIVRAYDAREIDGRLVLAMEFVEGLDLAKVVRRLGPLGTADACELARQAASGLQAAHEHGLIHRDVKPSNLMLTPEGRVKLLDLGLARFAGGGLSQFSRQDAAKMGLSPSAGGQAHFSALDGPKNEPVPEPMVDDDMTNTGQAMGTADYMAPEQASDSRAVDIRADIYSLGATLYKLLSAEAPFNGPAHQGTFDKLIAHRQEPIPPIRQRCPDVPPELAAVLDRMLAKDPAARFATPAEVAVALAPFCSAADLPRLAATAASQREGERQGEGPASSSPLPPGEGQGEGAAEKASPRSPEEIQGGANYNPPSPASGRGAGGEGILRTDTSASESRGRFVPPVFVSLALALCFGGLCFALGILIMVRKGDKTYQVEVPESSQTTVDQQGNVTVNLAETKESGKSPAIAPAAELSALQGQWKVVRVEKGRDANVSWGEICGFPVPTDPANVFRLDFAESEGAGILQIREFDPLFDSGEWAGGFAYRIDPTAAPKTIDLLLYVSKPGVMGESFSTLVAQGIYQLDGNRLTICLTRHLPSLRTDHRPKSLAVAPHSGDILFVLERHRPSGDEKTIQGYWKLTAEVKNGEPASEVKLRGAEYVFDDHRVLGDTLLFGAYLLHTTTQPKTITLGSGDFGKPQIRLGIYKLEGDRLTIAYHRGEPRPTKFESTAGSGITLLVLERTKPRAGPRVGLGHGFIFADAPGTSAPQTGQQSKPPAEPPLPTVTVAHPVIREVTDYQDFGGRIEPLKSAEVRPQVAGRVIKVNFHPGDAVKQGELLVELDPRSFELELTKRRAELDAAKARFQGAESSFDRVKRLIESHAAGQVDFDKVKSEREVAAATVRSAEAACELAQLNLSLTRIAAPIDGKISQIVPLMIDRLVTPESKEPLATIVALDSVYVAFDVDQRTVLELRRKAREAQGKAGQILPLTVLCGVPSDGSQSYPYQGKVESVDVPVNPATGTAQWRAALPNKDGALLPGMAARLRLATSSPYKALLIPTSALDSYQGREFVYVVTKKEGAQVVDRRPVRVGRPHDGSRVIEGGLTSDDRVVVSNIRGLSPGLGRGFGQAFRRGMGLQPGMRVKVEETPPPAAPPPPQAKPK